MEKTTKNSITGDKIKSKANSDAYRNNWDAIFGKRKPVVVSDDEQRAIDEAIYTENTRES